MAFNKGSIATHVAVVAGLLTVLSSTVYAQGGGAAPGAPPGAGPGRGAGGGGGGGGFGGGGGRGGGGNYTPAPDARDAKSVLFNWTWHMGMLRGVQEHELMVTLEQRAEGTMQVNGQTCTLNPFKEAEREGELGTAGYRVSHAYQFSGSRTQIKCTLPNGQAYSNIEVVSGTFAWDEDIPGAGLVAGQGTATPRPNLRDERMIRLFASPTGAPKAALHGAGIDLMKVFRNPGGLLAADVPKIGDTAVSWEGNTPVITYPIPGVSGATAVAKLDSRFMTQSVVVTHGNDRYEFTYGDYNDYNNELNRIELYTAGRMTERKNGTVTRDLTAKQTETGSIYVVVPVPQSVSGTAVAALPKYGSDTSAPPWAAEPAPTPRLPNGKPDLTGTWGGGTAAVATGGGSVNGKFFIWSYGNRRCAPTQLDGCSPQWNQTIDFEFEAASRFGPNRPLYKPEHWDKVIYLDMWTNRYDPIMTCQPMGQPRQGPPGRIYHTEGDITMLYGSGGDGGGGYPDFRVVATDGRAAPTNIVQTKYLGHSIGTWEDDTLVITSVGFPETTWLARGGFFHSENMKVTERFTRRGNQMLYEVTVEDPDVLLQPWSLNPLMLTQGGGGRGGGPGGGGGGAAGGRGAGGGAPGAAAPGRGAGAGPAGAAAAPAGPRAGGLVGAERGACQEEELDDIANQLRH